MSEFINNSAMRQEQLKAIIKNIHNGMPLEDAKKLFKEQFNEVSTEEITQMEHSLIEDGMDISEVQKLCDVHAAVFDGSISDIHSAKDLTQIPGHPAKVYKDENARILKLIEEEIRPYMGKSDSTSHLMLRVAVERLLEVSIHYSRKENLFFPGLEKKGITSIPKVMWGVDDEIRNALKEINNTLAQLEINFDEMFVKFEAALERVIDMVTKEDNIMLPMLCDKLSLYDWILAYEGSNEIGFFLDAPSEDWVKKEELPEESVEDFINGEVKFDAGVLLPVEINAILNTVPLDMTFVDKDGHVKYFTQGKERIFDRPHTVLGRHVSMCHPPQSVHVVEDIVNSFKNNEKDNEDFYINMGPKFVYIRYFAVRDKEGSYLGTLEVSQDIKPIRELVGEKRLMSK